MRLRDPVEKEKAEAAQCVSEERFRQLAENIRDVFFLIDTDSYRVLYISPAYEEIWGRSCESLYANPKSWIEVVHPEDRASTTEIQSRDLRGEVRMAYRIVRADGSIRWIDAKIFPVRNDAGEAGRIAASRRTSPSAS